MINVDVVISCSMLKSLSSRRVDHTLREKNIKLKYKCILILNKKTTQPFKLINVLFDHSVNNTSIIYGNLGVK